jgi:hypothetical protein
MRKHPRSRGFLGWCCVGLGMLVLQYVTVSHEDFGPIGHYTNPHPGPILWTLDRLSPVTLLPLGPIARDSVWTNGTRWTGVVMRAFPRFRDYRANNLTFSVLNTTFWLLAGATIRLAYLRIRRTLGRRKAMDPGSKALPL